MVRIKKNFVAESKYDLKCPYEMVPQYVVIHNTANNATAQNEIAYMKRNRKEVSFHYAVDHKEIVQAIPESRNAWHAGDGGNGKGNRYGIAIEIFKMEYHNDGYITVQSSNGDKVVAPGTENEYTFHFKNEGNAPGKYNMKLEAIFSQKDWPIPIEARMKNQNGEYILGSKDSWDNSPDLKEIKDSAVLGTNKFATYTFEWRWPFERGDGDELIANNEYDTFIADFESLYSKEMTMTLNISTSTELDYGVENSTDKVQGISSPYTGEMRNLAIRSAIVMLVLVTSIISIIHLERRQIKKIEALATKTAVNDTERENE